MIMKNKRGVSTIEMIVSFMIFLSFLIFILAYLNPLKKDVSGSLLVSLEAEFKKDASVDLYEWPIAINKSKITRSCITINIPFNKSISGNLSVKLIDDSTVNHMISADGNSIYVQNLDEKLYRLVKSDEIDKIDSELSDCESPPQFSWSIERVEEVYSYKNLIEINKTYYTNLKQLKQDINFPSNSEFAVYISSPEFNLTMTRNTIPNTRVSAKTFPIEILNNDNRIKALMTLVTW
jgi:hypothetical protein